MSITRISEALSYLDRAGIGYERHDHPAVFTVEEVTALVSIDRGIRTKNLFVRDKKGRRHILIVVPHDKSVDLMALGAAMGIGRLSFGSPERLMKYLSVEPGSVSLMGVINDRSVSVEIVVDQAIWDAAYVRCHPLVNTSTIVLSHEGMVRLFEATGHEALIMEVPAR